MSAGEEAGAGDRLAPGPIWPDIAVRVEARGIVPRWRASSVHPDLGPVGGRGMSRAAAIRSLVRGIRRRRVLPAVADADDARLGPADGPQRTLPP